MCFISINTIDFAGQSCKNQGQLGELVHVHDCVLIHYEILSHHCSVKEILGYDPKVLCADGVAIKDFIHPEDLSKARRRRKGECN